MTLEFSFYLTYAFLMTTGTITFIEALRTKNDSIRHILNLETCISVVAAFFYSNFIGQLDQPDYKKINLNRYVDWAITTPIMLLVLILAFKMNATNKATVKFRDYAIILGLNYGMLGSGYFGDIGIFSRLFATIAGFLFFGGLFYKLNDMKPTNPSNELLYGTFFILWALYGVFYQMDQLPRNVGYNILDLCSKCFVGIYFWAYYVNIFR